MKQTIDSSLRNESLKFEELSPKAKENAIKNFIAGEVENIESEFNDYYELQQEMIEAGTPYLLADRIYNTPEMKEAIVNELIEDEHIFTKEGKRIFEETNPKAIIGSGVEEKDYILHYEDFVKQYKTPYTDLGSRERIKCLEQRLFSNEWALNEVRATRDALTKLNDYAEHQLQSLRDSNAELLEALEEVLAYEKRGADKGEPRIGNGILSTIRKAINKAKSLNQ